MSRRMGLYGMGKEVANSVCWVTRDGLAQAVVLDGLVKFVQLDLDGVG
jgi:hypothetical protein